MNWRTFCHSHKGEHPRVEGCFLAPCPFNPEPRPTVPLRAGGSCRMRVAQSSGGLEDERMVGGEWRVEGLGFEVEVWG